MKWERNSAYSLTQLGNEIESLKTGKSPGKVLELFSYFHTNPVCNCQGNKPSLIRLCQFAVHSKGLCVTGPMASFFQVRKEDLEFRLEAAQADIFSTLQLMNAYHAGYFHVTTILSNF